MSEDSAGFDSLFVKGGGFTNSCKATQKFMEHEKSQLLIQLKGTLFWVVHRSLPCYLILDLAQQGMYWSCCPFVFDSSAKKTPVQRQQHMAQCAL